MNFKIIYYNMSSHTYEATNKTNTLHSIGINTPGFPVNNHYVTSTNDKLQTGPGYENLFMKTIINDKNGYRLFCFVKKGHFETPHFHKGRYELYVISGLIKYVNEETKEEVILKKGDYYCNPPFLKHSSVCLEDSEVLWFYDREPDCNCIHS